MRTAFLLSLMGSLFLSFTAKTTFHSFQLQKLDSQEFIKFSEFAGKKILVVNVASKCGYTKQYSALQELQQTYEDKLVVVGIPCNQFWHQEPGQESEIATFCSELYGVSFPMTTKINVKGRKQHPIYKWLTTKELNELGDFKVGWNFNKFLINENGELMRHFPSEVAPLSTEITSLL